MKKNKLIYSFENTISSHPKHSKFFRNQEHKTTMNASDLIPIFVDEVLPGDTFKLTTKVIIRQTTLIKPVMDNSYIDISYYFVPNRLIWDDWKKFMGENTDGAWAVQTKPTIPQITAPNEGWEIGTIADYMGIPTGILNLSVSALPIRAYTLIFNEWYRDQNLQQEVHLDKGSATKQGTNRNNYINDLECGGIPAKAGKYHDYFTSALPSPQKGQPISIPIGELAPVKTGTNRNEIPEEPLYMRGKKGSALGTGTTSLNINSTQNIGIVEQGNNISPPAGAAQMAPTNLYADLRQASSITINELREAITMQQLLELDARGGTRYVEMLKSHFGVNSGDARQQRPEYLGGIHQPLTVQQVPQTNSTDATTPQANLAAYGHSGLENRSFKKSFTEHGHIIGIATIRYNHTYQQGLEKMWNRKDREDFYDPIFANIGEQPILNKEIFAQGTDKDNETFGYQEPWAEYRYKPNRVSGKFRSKAKDPLDIWHYGDFYKKLPKLSAEWIQEDQSNIDRTLAIKSTGENAEPQYQCDFFFKNEIERPMPTYSIPGLNKI
ncbi:major capsid protein [Spiroplasma endosymbiont of Thecophora atra]|uniref:major capsid protein n=1 Tax=Spiroplasma endosymbiont of Thecophora atra TaxID=3066294 RepID=UPI0030CEF7F1